VHHCATDELIEPALPFRISEWVFMSSKKEARAMP
jgi:hypothetical protein